MIGLWSEHFPPAEKAPAPASRSEHFSSAEKAPAPASRSEHFPPAEKTSTPAPALAPPIPGRQRCFICPSCDAVCRLLTSGTPENPDRKFYTCPFRHNFFKWADEVKPTELLDVPNCGGCSAGVCRVRREKTGPNSGRILFMCRVKEGEGSCGYRVWQDELDMSVKELPDERLFQSTTTNCDDIGPANAEGRVTTLESAAINCDEIGPTNTVVVEETRQGDGALNNESLVIDTSQHCECLGVTSGEMGQFNGREENQNESSSRPPKRSRYGELKGDVSEGSCGYRVWQDEQDMSVKELPDESVFQSTTTNCDDIGPANADGRVTTLESATINCDEIGPTNTVVVEETRQGDGALNNESPVIDTSQHRECLGVTSGEMGQFNGREENQNESSSRPLKRSRYGELKGCILRKIASVKQIVGGRFSFHFRSLFAVFAFYCHNLTNSVSIKHSWKTAAMEQDLGTQLHGWWGRLAFHPMPCLMTHISKSFTFHVSSLDLRQDKIPVNSRNSTALTTPLLGAESYVKPPFNPGDNAGPLAAEPVSFSLDLPLSNEPFHETGSDNVMSESISKTFNQAAELLQNNLFTLLETMDVKDHEARSQAAESTFAALDGLLFDHQDFKKRAEELIHRARSLAEIEQSLPTINSSQQLVNHCSSQRRILDKINHLHAKAVDDVMSRKKHLIELQEEVCSTMEWIFQIQSKLSCFEVEMSTMEQQLEKISDTKDVLEGQYLIMSKELEESQRHYEQKEAERSAAKAAFDRAKVSLRG